MDIEVRGQAYTFTLFDETKIHYAKIWNRTVSAKPATDRNTCLSRNGTN
jgi:hypothetical protein